MNFIYDKINQCLNQLKKRIVIKRTELDGFLCLECDYKTGNDLPKVDKSWREFKKDDRWGGKKDLHYWFYKRIKTTNAVDLTIITGREGQWDAINPQFIVYLNGVLTQGMDVNHTTVPLEADKEYEIYLYAYVGMCDNLVGFRACLDETDKDIERLYYDIKVPFDICGYLEPNEKNYTDIIKYLENTVNLIDFRIPYSIEYNVTIKSAISYLKTEFYGKYCSGSDVTVVCIGHTHIDVAWLWTLAQTREKTIRSFATVINLMKQYPEYKFMSSQAQLYKYLKEESPELYDEVKNLIKQGRWEVEGAMWVEADCNLSSGESLVRQIMFGKRFFKEEFDVNSHVLWLPDVFGYSAAMPQILKKSGIDKFVTSKISWNETNQMPHDTFMWQGIDGTDILTYFLTAQDKVRGKQPVNYTTYNANITPQMVAGTWDRYQDKELNNETILTFGYGDGGGGPTKEMLEIGRRLSYGIKGCPAVRIDTATSFLNRLEKKIKNNRKLPRWVGELYLELHRGTYTSIAKNKRNNRKSEFLYQNIELLSCLDMVLNNSTYPQQEINNGWETILLNQFHDIIPGSSIKEVYDDSDEQYAYIQKRGNKILDEKYNMIAQNLSTDGGLLVFNPNSFKNSDIVEIDGKTVYVEDIPANGYKIVKDFKIKSGVRVEKDLIENKFFKVKLQNYDIVSIYDKENKREVVKKGQKANQILAFEDFPKNYDAWEISDYYNDKRWEVDDIKSAEMIDEGARAGFKIVRRFLNSVITQKIYLYADIARIDFDTNIEWNEEHIILKAAFPVDIHTEKATYDIQFGNVERPTHRNTSWDSAKFEVCAHKFADISEDNYGVSLLNDCKYGHDIIGSTIRLTLLKCATYPNPEADKGHHYFRYSLYPHTGNFKEGKTVQMAYSFNKPMTALTVGKTRGVLPEEYSIVKTDMENIIVETVKKAEDTGEIIVRLFDCYNRRTKPKVMFGFDVKEVYVTDLMENKIKLLSVKNNMVSIEVKPFEIVTLSVKKDLS